MVSVKKVTLLVTFLLCTSSTITLLQADTTECKSTNKKIPPRIRKRMNGTGLLRRKPSGRYTGHQLQLILDNLHLLEQIDAGAYKQWAKVFEKLELSITIPYNVSTFRESIQRLASRREQLDIFGWLSIRVTKDVSNISGQIHLQNKCRNHILTHPFSTEKLGDAFDHFEELSSEYQNLWFNAFDSIVQDRIAIAESPTIFMATDEEDLRKGIPYLYNKQYFTNLFLYLQKELRENLNFITHKTIACFIYAYHKTENAIEKIESDIDSEVSE